MKKRFVSVLFLLLTLCLPHATVQADADGTTIYIPLVSVGNADPNPAGENGSLTELPSDTTAVSIEQPYHLYLPQISHPSILQDDEINAALWGWSWWDLFNLSDDNFSLKIEKRDFDAGGNGFQINLLLIPRIIDLLDFLNLSPDAARKVWGLTNSRLNEAQSLSRGSGITVAVLDTGISLLTSELYFRTVNGYDFVDNDRYPYEDLNYRDDDRDGQTDEGAGHGTFVSSIIAAATRSARIMPIRVLNSDGNGTPEMVARGIRYAADHGAHIINLSLSSDTDDSGVRDAIRYATDRGVVVVAAALSNDSHLGFPAGYPSVISVGAISRDNTLPAFVLPNASKISVFAPGVDIYGPALLGQDVWMSGNSMATAFVSAEAALLMEGGRCTAACVRTTLTTRVKPVTPDQGSRGRIDVYDALVNRP